MSRPWLAIDPSFRNTGWAHMDETLVYDIGLIRTVRNKDKLVYLDNKYCLEYIACQLGDAATDCLHLRSGAEVYAEAKGGSKSAKAAAAMAMAQGVMIGTLARHYNITLMLPQAVKKAVCGDRTASKDDIRTAVDKLYPDAFAMMERRGFKAKKYNEHIYDAIAIGWAIHQTKGAS